MADAAFVGSTHLWVVEATLDLPVCLQGGSREFLKASYISLGGEDPDGFVEMHPVDVGWSTSSVFWSAQKPIVHECAH